MTEEIGLNPIKMYYLGEVCNHKCPICGEYVHPVVTPQYCPTCNQKLDWNERHEELK